MDNRVSKQSSYTQKSLIASHRKSNDSALRAEAEMFKATRQSKKTKNNHSAAEGKEPRLTERAVKQQKTSELSKKQQAKLQESLVRLTQLKKDVKTTSAQLFTKEPKDRAIPSWKKFHNEVDQKAQELTKLLQHVDINTISKNTVFAEDLENALFLIAELRGKNTDNDWSDKIQVLDFQAKALAIQERRLGDENPMVQKSRENIVYNLGLALGSEDLRQFTMGNNKSDFKKANLQELIHLIKYLSPILTGDSIETDGQLTEFISAIRQIFQDIAKEQVETRKDAATLKSRRDENILKSRNAAISIDTMKKKLTEPSSHPPAPSKLPPPPPKDLKSASKARKGLREATEEMHKQTKPSPQDKKLHRRNAAAYFNKRIK